MSCATTFTRESRPRLGTTPSMTSVSARSTPSRPTVAPAWTLEFATRNGRRRVVPAVRDASQRSTTQRVGNVEQPPQVLLPLSVGEMTLRLHSALSYSQNSARDLRCALNRS